MKLQHKSVSPPSDRVSTMPEKPFPPHLKLQRLALARAEITGLISSNQFERLREHGAVQPEALEAAEPLVLTLSFGFDSEGWLVIKGNLDGSLPLVCQRCLESYERPINLSICLARVTDECDLERLPGEYEPLLHQEESIGTVDLIEDDVLLSLPLVPKHDIGACSASFDEASPELGVPKEVAPAVQRRGSPFQMLASLKVGASAPEESTPEE